MLQHLLRFLAVGLSLMFAWNISARAETEEDAVRIADRAFYTALEHSDIAAMKSLWANEPWVINVGPRSKTMNVGYPEVTKYWEGAFEFFSRLSVTKTVTQLRIDGSVAWIVGTESADLQPRRGGEPLKFDTFVTHIYRKQGNHWMLVEHHAQMIPH